MTNMNNEEMLKIGQLNLDSHMSVEQIYQRYRTDDVKGAQLFDKNGRSMAFIITPQLLQDIVESLYPGKNLDELLWGSSIPASENPESVPFIEKNHFAMQLVETIYRAVEIQKETINYNQELSRQIDAIFDSSFDGLYMTDGEGNTLRLNKSFERITGLPAQVCVGRNMADLVKEGIYSRSGTLIALKQRRRITTTLETNTGKTVLATSNPIFDDKQNIILVVTAICDITELNDLQRKTIEKEESNLSKATLPDLELPNGKKYMIRSPNMRSLVDMTVRIAASDSTVLIQGESGVGKELIVDLIHANSTRKNSPLIKVNCGAIPVNLLESELFGYEPGAFSGASKLGKAGYFEMANNGILFLDEVGEMPLDLQVKMLRVLQEKEVCRIGGGKVLKLDVRIVAATNSNLYEMVLENKFRHDLYYRLNVVPIYVPALRDRKVDIPALSNFFLDNFNTKYGMYKQITPEVMQCFSNYVWPGNIRQLENLIERLLVTVDYDTITTNDLPPCIRGNKKNKRDIELVPLRQAVENTERQMLEKACAHYNSTYEVAKALEINQSTVVRKLAKYGIEIKSKSSDHASLN